MQKLGVVFAALLLVFCFSGNLAAQGLMDILDRLETLEQQMKELQKNYQKELHDLKGRVSESESQPQSSSDLTVYDETLLEMASTINILEKEIKTLRREQDQTENAQNALLADLDMQIGSIEPVDQPEPAQPEWNPWGVEFSGFVDGSYYVDVPTGENTFGFDQAEVDIAKEFNDIGSLRIDVEWVNDGSGNFDLDAEQGYVTFSPEFFGPAQLTFGKFNAPIGFEGVDAPDLYQYSFGLVGTYGLPTNYTGAMLNFDFGYGFDLATYVTNGWDQNVDLNTGKTFGWRFGYTGYNWGGVGLSFVRGPETAAEGDVTTIVDLDGTVMPLSWWTLGTDVNFGRQEISGVDADWWGFLLMSHMEYSSWGGVTLRFDYFDDQNGARLESGLSEKRKAVTLAPTFSLGDGMGALVEARVDLSDKEVFADDDGDLKKSRISIAYEMTYSF